ncbi:MAG: ROK family protein [Acidobacteriaceae bacterium]|nr:ROK family protein [Acidobacteriaceae bacterium]
MKFQNIPPHINYGYVHDEDMRVLAIDIGGTKFTLGAFECGRLTLRESRITDRSGGPAWMFSQIERIFDEWRQKGFQPDSCGIGFGGPVHFSSQTVTLSTHVAGWAEYPLVENVKRLTGAPAIMDNDANVGALGEACHGAGRGADPLFYMTLSTGIGGGMVIDGRVYRGADSFAGEIGHLTIVPDGPDCLCGSRGCYERMCCGLWLERDYGKPAKELLLEPEFVRRYVVYLARGLKAALMLLNPARIVIGGGISKAGERLFVPLREELGRQMTSWSRARRTVVPAELGDDSVLYGALALAGTLQPSDLATTRVSQI